jgi:hypothetical protein
VALLVAGEAPYAAKHHVALLQKNLLRDVLQLFSEAGSTENRLINRGGYNNRLTK